MTAPTEHAAMKPMNCLSHRGSRDSPKLKRRLSTKLKTIESKMAKATAGLSSSPRRSKNVSNTRLTSVPRPPTVRNCTSCDHAPNLKV